jgi:S-adenosylmethionine:tRNA ribosyltransferase-isomerase
MNVSDFNYCLPEELIAQSPLEKRDLSRLMILDRKTEEIEHKSFKDIVSFLNEGDCLVINNTRVIPARLYGVKISTGAKMELLLLKDLGNNQWEVMTKPGRKAQKGTKISFAEGLLEAEILDIVEDGNRIVKFQYEGIFNEVLDKIGLMPLPPYIKETLEDKERYQTVYSKYKGSAAAPTAGLHFTNELLQSIIDKKITIANVTLHVGIGTFRPVKVDKIEEHKMHSEYFYIKQEDCEIINKAKKNGGKVIAVGTTSCRVLESVADESGFLNPFEGTTDIFIYPGYKFKIVDNLITNFHLPESTLLMLVSTLAGYDNIMSAYKEAVEHRYRFFSFGDAMYIK